MTLPYRSLPEGAPGLTSPVWAMRAALPVRYRSPGSV